MTTSSTIKVVADHNSLVDMSSTSVLLTQVQLYFKSSENKKCVFLIMWIVTDVAWKRKKINLGGLMRFAKAHYKNYVMQCLQYKNTFNINTKMM